MKKYIPLLFTLVFISGCSNRPQPATSKLTFGTVQSTVVEGANQTDITRSLGSPNIISKDKQGNETWTYDRVSRENESKNIAGLGFGGLFGWMWGGTASKSSSSTSSKSLTVIITFDDNKNVLDFAYQSLKY